MDVVNSSISRKGFLALQKDSKEAVPLALIEFKFVLPDKSFTVENFIPFTFSTKIFMKGCSAGLWGGSVLVKEVCMGIKLLKLLL